MFYCFLLLAAAAADISTDMADVQTKIDAIEATDDYAVVRAQKIEQELKALEARWVGKTATYPKIKVKDIITESAGHRLIIDGWDLPTVQLTKEELQHKPLYISVVGRLFFEKDGSRSFGATNDKEEESLRQYRRLLRTVGGISCWETKKSYRGVYLGDWTIKVLPK